MSGAKAKQSTQTRDRASFTAAVLTLFHLYSACASAFWRSSCSSLLRNASMRAEAKYLAMKMIWVVKSIHPSAADRTLR